MAKSTAAILLRIGRRDGWRCRYCNDRLARLDTDEGWTWMPGSAACDDECRSVLYQHYRCPHGGRWCLDEGYYPAEIEHVVPRSRDGTNLMANLALACSWCNLRKKDHLLSELPEGWMLEKHRGKTSDWWSPEVVVSRAETIAALRHVRGLVSADLSDADLDETAAGIREAEMTTDRGPLWAGRLVAELRRRNVSWSQLVQMTGVPQTTLVRRAETAESYHPVDDQQQS